MHILRQSEKQAPAWYHPTGQGDIRVDCRTSHMAGVAQNVLPRLGCALGVATYAWVHP